MELLLAMLQKRMLKETIREYIIFADCAPLEKYKTGINNTQIDNSKDLNIVMPVYNIGV